MKTAIIEFTNSAPFHIRTGWSQVLRSSGWKVIEWWPEKMSTFDVFNGLEVDLFIGTTYNLTRPLDKIIRSRPNMKVALFASAWGDLTDEIDSTVYPIVKVSKEEKGILGKLYNDVQKPDLVFIHITESHLIGSLGKWATDLGIPIMGLLNAADLFTYYGVSGEEKYKADVSFVGGYWPYKALTLDKYIGRLCDEELFNLDIKIYGAGWNKPQYLGSLDMGEDAKVFCSSKICPNVSEAHSEKFGFDLVERVFKIPCAKGFLISDYVDELEEIYPNQICPTFKNYDEFLDLIFFYSKDENNQSKQELIEKQHFQIIKNHTYHHRMSKLMTYLNLPQESENIMSNYLKIISNI